MGVRYLHGNRIVVYGLSETDLEIVKKCTIRKNIEIFYAEEAVDIIANDAFAIIINSACLSEEDNKFIHSYYNEVEHFEETVILFGVKSYQFNNPRIKYFDSFIEVKKELQYLILNARSIKQKRETFGRSLSYALAILKMIAVKPGITTREISDRLEISPRSVTRYIETLNVAGESIVYNSKSKGWSLQFGESLLKLGI